MNDLDESLKVVFNHYYKMRHDIKRTILYSLEEGIDISIKGDVNSNWVSKIHPVYAMLFSFLSYPITLRELYDYISYFLDVSQADAKGIINPFINQESPFSIQFEGNNLFPKNLIVYSSQIHPNTIEYTPTQFAYNNIDISNERYFRCPHTMVFMVNNRCITDCVYCYADKNHKSREMSFNKLHEIIKSARTMGISAFMPTGGEFFLYKYWKELIEVLYENKFDFRVISTKVPLTEEQIKFVKKFNLKIQFSLDSIDADDLSKILNVKTDYLKKIKKTLDLFEFYEIPFQVGTVITKYNVEIKKLENLHNFLSGFNLLQQWEIRLAFKSLYSRGKFDNIKVNREEIRNIDSWIQLRLSDTKIKNILWDNTGIDRYFKSINGSKSFIGSRCSANYSNLFLLPDGKVTLCEQLYWNPDFIIGDLTKESIEEVWNSPKALALAYPNKQNFSDKSICKHCDIFDECYSYPNKCILDVLKGYGKENMDYPDPRCIKAPPFINELRY